MKGKALTVLLLANILLFGFGLYFLQQASQRAKQEKQAQATNDFRERLKSVRSDARLTKSGLKSAFLPNANGTNQFRWSQIESDDYREYIANLRSIGCPEATIKDIIMTDIMRLYAAQRGQFYHNGREFRFWETNEKRKLNAKQLEEREKQLATIDKEIPAVLRELLGINYEREINKYFVDNNEDERRLNFVSEDKRSKLLALREEFEDTKERIMEAANGGALSDEAREALRKAEQERHDKLAKILTPSESEEFDLRTSETAEHLREALIGFNPSEEEFRELYLMQKALDEKLSSTKADDREAQSQKLAEQQKIEDEVRAKFGEERYTEYQRAKNPDFRSACLFTELYELPQSTAASIYDIQQIARRESQSLLVNQNIPEDRRAVVLEAIRTETEQSLQQILGAKVYSSYAQSSGKWIQELGGPN